MITDNLSQRRCCGCAACVNVCPRHCLSMVQSDGFYYPKCDQSACNDCGLCDRSCPAYHSETMQLEAKNTPNAYGGWALDDTLLQKSSSGAIFPVVALRVLEMGGEVYGASFNENMLVSHRAVHIKAELSLLQNSKYVQSNIGDTFTRIAGALKLGKKVLFSGTPCQAAGLSTFISCDDSLIPYRDNLIILDIICHGVPSPKFLEDYFEYLEQRYKEPLKSYKFRTKQYGWHQSGLQLGSNATFLSGKSVMFAPAIMDKYMVAFLNNLCLRESCYQCQFKTAAKPYADISLGDFWGVGKSYPDLYNKKGTSLILIHSKKGQALLDVCKKDLYFQKVDYVKARQTNPMIESSAQRNNIKGKPFHLLAKEKSFAWLARRYLTPLNWVGQKIQGITKPK